MIKKTKNSLKILTEKEVLVKKKVQNFKELKGKVYEKRIVNNYKLLKKDEKICKKTWINRRKKLFP